MNRDSAQRRRKRQKTAGAAEQALVAGAGVAQELQGSYKKVAYGNQQGGSRSNEGPRRAAPPRPGKCQTRHANNASDDDGGGGGVTLRSSVLAGRRQ